MVIMAVRNQHEINRRQISHRDPRRAYTLWPGKGEGAGKGRPDRISDDVQPRCLDQHSNMANHGQADIIPVSRKRSISVNMEDGLLLADAGLRSELERCQPELYRRCQARRRFMIDMLGYRLSEAVLPLGNIPGAYFPCLLDTGVVCCHV